ncbi:MAG TPA: peptide ABC transporter substrate-binding protein [Candidatus Tumulicola sp.]|nr:peptide ABC transporter substrate-binding protein [Candidatus Tumulicola sp.]
MRYAAFLSILIALVACSKVSEAPTRGAGNPWTIHGVVRFAESEEPNTLVRMFSNQASADDVTALLFEPFFRFDDRGRPVPSLATIFPSPQNGLISKDGLRVTFKLRKEVLWSDGVPVTAKDVIFTWRAIMGGNNPVVRTAGFDKIKDIVADDEHQVTIVLKEPFSPAVYLFSEGDFPPLPAHLLSRYKTLHNIAYDAAPIGDGPFVLQHWEHGSELVFAPNARYWRGKPRLDQIIIKVVPNTNTVVQLLRTHELDVVDGVAKPQVHDLDAIDGIRVTKHMIANYRHLDFNCKSPLLSDVALRRAIAQAIDVDRIIKAVYGGYAIRAVTDIPPFSWAANALEPPAHDPSAARTTLDKAGWSPDQDGVRVKNGQRLALTISTAADNRAGAAAEALIAQELKDVGIDLTIKNYAGAVLFAENGPLYGGKYDMAWIVNTEGTDPDNLALWGCAYWPPHGGNTNFYCNRRVDAYLADAQHVFDQAARRRDYEAAWRIMLQEVPAVIIYWDNSVVAANSDLRGYKPSPVITDFWNAWEWEI